MAKDKSTDSKKKNVKQSYEFTESKTGTSSDLLESELNEATSLDNPDNHSQNDFNNESTSTTSDLLESELNEAASLVNPDNHSQNDFTNESTSTTSDPVESELNDAASLNNPENHSQNDFTNERTGTSSGLLKPELNEATSLVNPDNHSQNDFTNESTSTTSGPVESDEKHKISQNEADEEQKSKITDPNTLLKLQYIDHATELENIYANQQINILSDNYSKYKSQLSLKTLLLNPGSIEIYEFENEEKVIQISDTLLHCMIEKNTPQDQIYEFISKIYQWLRFDNLLAHNYFSLQNSEKKTIIECIIEKYGNNFYASLSQLWSSVFPSRLHIGDEDHHTHSINRSVHNSYIRLFSNLFPQMITSSNENGITIKRNQNWLNHINKVIDALNSKVHFLLAENNLSANLITLYNNKLPENFEEKVDIWRFRLNSVARLLDDVKNNKRFGNTYPIQPDAITLNGFLSIKEMIAICYQSLAFEVDKTKRSETWHNPELALNQFFQFIKNLYIARRGYNTDIYAERDYEIYKQQQTNPNDPIKDNVVDQNRCETGMTNQIILGIKDHKLVQIVNINLQIFATSISKRLKPVLKNIYRITPRILRSSIEKKMISIDLKNNILFELLQDKELIREYGADYIREKISSALDLIGYDTIVSYLTALNIHIPINFEFLWRTFSFHEERGYIPYLEALYISVPETQNRDQDIKNYLFYILEQRNSSKDSIAMLELLLNSSDSKFVSLIKSVIEEYLPELDRDPNYSFVNHAILTGSINLLTSIPNYADYLQKEHLLFAIENNNYEIFQLVNIANPDLIFSIDRNTLLVNAVNSGHPLILSDICSLLKFTASELNIRADNQDTLLIAVIRQHNLQIAQILIQAGIDINASGENGFAALHYASYCGMTELIKLLIKHNVEIDKLSDEKDPPLILAVQNKMTNAVISLINGGADINIKDIKGNTALFLATYNKFYDIVKLLIKTGANRNDRNLKGLAPIHQASHLRDDTLVELLIEYNISDKTIKPYNTELHLAVLYSQTEKALQLIDQGANINALNNMGDSALILAMHTGNNQVALSLINKNANLDIQDSHGKTALIWAIFHKNTELALTLINKNANLHCNDNFGNTALSFAIENNLTEVVLALIKKGACSEFDSQQILILLEMALRHSNSKISIALINKLNDTTVLKENHLFIISAIEKNLDDVVHALIDKGASINACDEDNCSALMIAIRYNYTDLAIKLLNKGAEIYIEDKDDKTAIIHAIEMSNIKVINAIIASETERHHQVKNFYYEELRSAISFNNRDIVHTILTRAIEIMHKYTLRRSTIDEMIQDFDKYHERYSQYGNSIAADKVDFLYCVGLSMIIPQNNMNFALDGKNCTLLHLALKYGAHFNEEKALELKTVKDIKIVLALAKKGYIAKYSYNLNPDDQIFNEAAKNLDNTMNKIKSLKSELARDFSDTRDHQKFISTIRNPIFKSLQVNQKKIDEATAASLNKKIQKEGQRVFYPKFTNKLIKERLSLSLTAISAKAVLLFSR